MAGDSKRMCVSRVIAGDSKRVFVSRSTRIRSKGS